MTDVAANGISVLLADDHPIVRQGYRRVLESQGDLHVVAEADNAAEAYSAFKTHDPDVVVMDISMPGASGLEAIRNIRARSPRARLPTVRPRHHVSDATGYPNSTSVMRIA